MNIDSLYEKFSTSDACEQYLYSTLWRDGRSCPHCGSLKSWKLAKRSILGRYKCVGCHKSFTITTKTPMHSTKLSIRKWLIAIYLMTTSPKGLSSLTLARWLGLSQSAAWKLGHAIREMMDQDLFTGTKFSGEVEFDEKYAGGKPRYKQKMTANYSRINDKMPIMIIAERNGRVAAKAVNRFIKTNFDAFAGRYVDTASMIFSDEHGMYKSCSTTFAGHEAVNHSIGEYVKGSAHDNTCESFNSLLERQYVGTHHRISKEHMQRYVNEQVFKWNARVNLDTAEFALGKRPRLKVLHTMEWLLNNCGLKQLRRSINGGIASLTNILDFPDSYANSVAFGI